MKNTTVVLTVALLTVLIGMGVFLSGRKATPGQSISPSTATAVPFTELARGDQSTVERRVNYVITSSEQFRELWEMIGKGKQAPPIDFSKSAVAAVFAGVKPTGGYGIAVSKVEDASARKITVALTQPGSDCVLAQAMTAPYQIIELPNTTLSFIHTDISTTADCTR